jgi:hypothetical protein
MNAFIVIHHVQPVMDQAIIIVLVVQRMLFSILLTIPVIVKQELS